MKKLLSLSALLGVMAVSAQENSGSDLMNDVMISPIELIAGPALNVSYERLLNKDSGIGINGVFILNSDDEGLRSQISPYYRMYFGKKYAAGFFVEGFVPITTSNDSWVNYNYVTGNNMYYETKEEINTTVGIGVGFGGKWIARNNIIFEASMGIARRFGLDEQNNGSEITGKGMLGIGYRF